MLHLIAVFAIGFAAAGFVLLAFRLRGKKPPRYLIPLAAGLSMVGYALWSEYSWASRTIAGLPDHVTVVKRIPSSAPWKPWTYIFPQVDRFIAVDSAEIRRNDRLPGLVLAEVILVARLEPAVTTRQLFDCPQARRADVIASDDFTDEGLPLNPDWVALELDDDLYKAVCQGT